MIAGEQTDTNVIGPRVAFFGGKEDVMKETIDARYESQNDCLEQELTEERFLEQFAALEDSLTLLQAHMRSMSENAKLFGSLARHIRRSTCPTTGHQNEVSADCGLANSPISDHRE